MELWTLGELAERVEAALADYPGQANGRVRAVPDQRTIRWYTTTGLVDRPTEMRGRTALYSHRHLLQLVAIKRRQSQGQTIAQIQSELAGATDESLQPIAALPEPLPALPSDRPELVKLKNTPAPDSRPAPARARFWADQPPPTAADPLPEPTEAEVVTAIRLAAGVTVVLDQGGTVPDPARLAAAAAPLLAELLRQGVLSQSSGDES